MIGGSDVCLVSGFLFCVLAAVSKITNGKMTEKSVIMNPRVTHKTKSRGSVLFLSVQTVQLRTVFVLLLVYNPNSATNDETSDEC